jgi:hypothetical protein
MSEVGGAFLSQALYEFMAVREAFVPTAPPRYAITRTPLPPGAPVPPNTPVGSNALAPPRAADAMDVDGGHGAGGGSAAAAARNGGGSSGGAPALAPQYVTGGTSGSAARWLVRRRQLEGETTSFRRAASEDVWDDAKKCACDVHEVGFDAK